MTDNLIHATQAPSAPSSTNGTDPASQAAHGFPLGRDGASTADPAPGRHWRVEMRDGDQWIPVGTPCPTREDAEYLLHLRGGTGLTYRITHTQPDSIDPETSR